MFAYILCICVFAYSFFKCMHVCLLKNFVFFCACVCSLMYVCMCMFAYILCMCVCFYIFVHMCVRLLFSIVQGEHQQFLNQ